MLDQVSVLVVEDDPFIALDLAEAIEQAGGSVIGPSASVREALLLIELHLVRAAIVDVNLSDRDITPVAELLAEGGVPLIFYSGLALPASLRERYPFASFYKKPTPPVRLVSELVALIRKNGAASLGARVTGRPENPESRRTRRSPKRRMDGDQYRQDGSAGKPALMKSSLSLLRRRAATESGLT
jgi:DNA-binding response OmpR family regulator